MQAVAGFMPKKFEIGCHLKPPLRVDCKRFLLTTVPAGSFSGLNSRQRHCQPVSEAQRKKQNCGGMEIKNNQFLNAIPREKFGLPAGIQTDNIPSSY
jgi:hypothetical protein